MKRCVVWLENRYRHIRRWRGEAPHLQCQSHAKRRRLCSVHQHCARMGRVGRRRHTGRGRELGQNQTAGAGGQSNTLALFGPSHAGTRAHFVSAFFRFFDLISSLATPLLQLSGDASLLFPILVAQTFAKVVEERKAVPHPRPPCHRCTLLASLLALLCRRPQNLQP